jgi:hypothetical protein
LESGLLKENFSLNEKGEEIKLTANNQGLELDEKYGLFWGTEIL